MAHRNARLGPAGRRELVRLMIEMGLSERSAGGVFLVSPGTAHRWKTRWLGRQRDVLPGRVDGSGRWG